MCALSGKGKASPRGSPQRAHAILDEEGALRMIQVCLFVCVCLFVRVHVCVFVCVYVYMCVLVHMCLCVCAHVKVCEDDVLCQATQGHVAREVFVAFWSRV
jgi:hypothetical protein